MSLEKVDCASIRNRNARIGCAVGKRLKPDAVPGTSTERVGYPWEPYRFFFVAHWIAASLTYRMPTLLWITEWGIWPTSENWHLYYRLRQTYSDHRLLDEAP